MNEQQSNDNNSEIIPITGPEAKALGIEYEALMTAESLSEAQEARIAEILDLAITHEEVDFWVSHSTDSQAMEAGLLSEDAKTNFENQKAMLREHLGQANLPPIRNRATVSIEAQLNSQLEETSINSMMAATHNMNTNDPTRHN
jgi:hypothetical protein